MNTRSEIKLHRIIKVANWWACYLLLLFKKQPIAQHLFCINYVCIKLIKFVLIKRYHLHMCNRAFPLFEKLLEWNLHVNCHVNGTTFQEVSNQLEFTSVLLLACSKIQWHFATPSFENIFDIFFFRVILLLLRQT